MHAPGQVTTVKLHGVVSAADAWFGEAFDEVNMKDVVTNTTHVRNKMN